MKHSMSTRLLSLLLTIALLFGCCPFALAAEIGEAGDTALITEQTESPHRSGDRPGDGSRRADRRRTSGDRNRSGAGAADGRNH